MPRESDVDFLVAVGGKTAPLKRLEDYGWRAIDGPTATLGADQYRQFIMDSRGEFSIAKNVYVEMRSGWFSTRSVCYLASGRPIVVQDTGFSKVIPVGEGLLTFGNFAEALEAIKMVESDYDHHRRMARSVAAEYFSSAKVLRQFLDDI